MNSSTANDFEISKSSLVGLKAELLKKQEEVKKFRELQQTTFKPVTNPVKRTNIQKQNKNIEDRKLKDQESFEDDVDIHKKSREILEAKSRLYEKLKVSGSDSNSPYLTDFNLKNEIYEKRESAYEKKEEAVQESDNEEGHYSESNSDPENDWVDFMDALGRTRRCLRKDLEEMKERDSKLAKSLRPPTPPPVPEVTPELMSWDMQREQMRKKWEEQEKLLLGKNNIHYQDILFDEARPHGVGYFEFAIDENERLRQQQALKNLRHETVEQQQAAEGLRVRRQKQLQARLAAAHRRRRERLGLPPEEPQLEVTEDVITSTDIEENQVKEEIKDLEESITRIAPVRPWDLGKESLDNVMSQEEWIEKKRLERPEEFAPPKIKHVEVAHENKCTTSVNRKIESNKIKKYSKRNKGKVIYDVDKLENYVNNKSSGSPVENLKRKDLQSKVSMESMPYLVQKNIVAEESNYCKKTSEDIDAFLSRVRASCSTPTSQDLKNNAINADNSLLNNKSVADCNGSITKIPKFKPKQKSTLFRNSKSITTNEDTNVSKCEISEKCIYSNIDNNVETISQTNSFNLAKTISRPINIEEEISTEAETKKHNISKRKWAEIAPPVSMSYYTSNVANKQSNTESNLRLADSISVGLNYLKTQTEKNEKKRIKGLLDII